MVYNGFIYLYLMVLYIYYLFSQEEALAKQAPSSYPEAEMILNSITPFLQLYQLYIDWDEAEKE